MRFGCQPKKGKRKKCRTRQHKNKIITEALAFETFLGVRRKEEAHWLIITMDGLNNYSIKVHHRAIINCLQLTVPWNI